MLLGSVNLINRLVVALMGISSYVFALWFRRSPVLAVFGPLGVLVISWFVVHPEIALVRLKWMIEAAIKFGRYPLQF